MDSKQNIIVELSAVIVSVCEGQPLLVVTRRRALPSGPLETRHKKLEQALRSWVLAQAGLRLGYVEQLYTFADKDREADGRRVISIGYLALAQKLEGMSAEDIAPIDWYAFLPWEDRRTSSADALIKHIIKRLSLWKNEGTDAKTRALRAARIAVNFPRDLKDWNEELVLQRYELLWEAGLIDESARGSAGRSNDKNAALGLPMPHDHRRILATGIARLRAKIKYRPVVFELLPAQFTLYQLQTTVEALAGLRLHKQNFRRLVQGQGLVEETPKQTTTARGRPAKLFAYRRDLIEQRALAGTKLPRGG